MSRTDLDNFTFSDSVPPSEYDDTGGHEVIEAMNYMDIKGQDVTEPVWNPKPIEPPARDMEEMRAKHEHAGELRTVDGLLDFLTDVVDEVTDWIERDTQEGRAHRPMRAGDKPMTLWIYNRASRSCRCNTFSIDQGKRIVEERPNRQRVVITNWSAGIIYISHQSDASLTNVPQPNMVQIAANGSRTFQSSGELWAYPAVPGTAQIIDVQDEYGWPEQ